MKKMISFLMATVLVFSLVSCNSSNKYPSDEQVLSDIQTGELPFGVKEIKDFKSNDYKEKDGMIYVYGSITYNKRTYTDDNKISEEENIQEMKVYVLYEKFDDGSYKYGIILEDK